MSSFSVTVSAGIGAEKHNHDKKYRDKLEHVEERGEIIELVPYKPYKEQINEIMKSHIEKYNAKQAERYQEAWDRFNAGLIKTKPRKANYKPMSYDYYAEHINDTYTDKAKQKHPKPLYRSMIIGIGDQKDKELLTTEQFKEIMSETVEQFQKDFPEFKILGATIHEDEKGFHHMHLDFMPLYSKSGKYQGLDIGRGLDEALKKMGYKPEQSLINGRDKAPIYFNTLRNRIYKAVEDSLNARGHTLLYNATFYKQPEHDSSVNQKLDRWQATKDTAFTMQKYKNELLELNNDNTIDEELKLQSIAEATIKFEKAFNEIEEIPFSTLRKNKVINFNVFSQLQSFTRNLLSKIRDLAEIAQNALKSLKKANLKIDELSKVVETQNRQIESYTRDNPLAHENQKLKLEAKELSTQINKLEYNSTRLKERVKQIDKLENKISQLENDKDFLFSISEENQNQVNKLEAFVKGYYKHLGCTEKEAESNLEFIYDMPYSGYIVGEQVILKCHDLITDNTYSITFDSDENAIDFIALMQEDKNVELIKTKDLERILNNFRKQHNKSHHHDIEL